MENITSRENGSPKIEQPDMFSNLPPVDAEPVLPPVESEIELPAPETSAEEDQNDLDDGPLCQYCENTNKNCLYCGGRWVNNK